jgi:glucose-1-phosphate thymidylyltransferase
MMPILNKPILEYVLQAVEGAHFDKVILVIGEDGGQIRNYFSEKGLSVELSYATQRRPLGMAHALNCAKRLVDENDFLVIASDSIVPPKYLVRLFKRHLNEGTDAMLGLMRVSWDRIVDLSSVVLERDGRISLIIEKPTWEKVPSNVASMPVYVFSRAIFDYLPRVRPSPRGELELQDAIQMMINDRLLVKGCFISRSFHLTSIEDLLHINWTLLKRSGVKFLIGNRCQVASNAVIGPLAVLGDGCWVGERVQVSRCIAMEGVRIGDDSCVMNAILGKGVKIGSDCLVGGRDRITVLADGVSIQSSEKI